MRTEPQIRSKIADIERYMQPLKRQIASLRRELRERKAERLGTVIRKGQGCRDRNEELKRKRGYTNPSSYVRRDGSEKLVDEDWRKRVEELRERSGGRCEMIHFPEMFRAEDVVGLTIEEMRADGKYRCLSQATDPHHKIKRSLYRDDRMDNLLDLCRPDHDLLDPRKPRWTKRERATA